MWQPYFPRTQQKSIASGSTVEHGLGKRVIISKIILTEEGRGGQAQGSPGVAVRVEGVDAHTRNLIKCRGAGKREARMLLRLLAGATGWIGDTGRGARSWRERITFVFLARLV